MPDEHHLILHQATGNILGSCPNTSIPHRTRRAKSSVTANSECPTENGTRICNGLPSPPRKRGSRATAAVLGSLDSRFRGNDESTTAFLDLLSVGLLVAPLLAMTFGCHCERSDLTARAGRGGAGSGRPWGRCLCRFRGGTSSWWRKLSITPCPSSRRPDRQCARPSPW
jgi:hypothetical protein